MKITREKLRRWGACYNDGRIAELVPEAGLTPLEVAALDIPTEDRLWVLLREDIIPARELRLLACGWAEAACLKAGWNDARSLAAIAVARRFAVGEVSAAELNAAGKAAWAAESATFAAELDAGRAAAWSASREPEWAAWAAVQAARAAASEAAAEEQLADVVKVLKAGTNNTTCPGRPRGETASIIVFAIITLLLIPIWAPLAMVYCLVTGKSLRDVNGYNNEEETI